MAGAGHVSCYATATKWTHSKLSRTGAVVETDSDLETVLSVSKTEEDSLHCSPERSSSSLRREGPKRSREGMKEEKSKLAWADQKVEEGRLHFAQMPQMKATKGKYAKKVEEILATKRQRSTESVSKDTPASKRQRGPKGAGPPPKTAKNPKPKAKVNEVTKRHLIVALNRSDENGKMTATRWKMVHVQLVESLFGRMEEYPTAPMPTFDGAGWLNGVKILKCMDDPTLKWLTQMVCQLEALSYAFRRNRSSVLCINDLINKVLALHARGYQVVAACLDLQKAFDCVRVDNLEQKISVMQFDPNLITWITSFLNRRILIKG
ncbi:uncharacterized protein LOC121404836 [Drosophila obscura]|uniref:uncharacterized protein LOC121404836 n=1 Tax=Drosophila obscura TaxID=7282 RepID=UPI001BB14A50|nr:uncharacterized protein LOC121404836 [Drosophila obscura]